MEIASQSAVEQPADLTSSAASGPQQATYDPKAVVAEVDQKYGSWRQIKRPNEIQWYINAATVRGLQNVQFNSITNQFERSRVPQHKLRPTINKVISKYRARKSKYLKNRYTPLVVPASSDREDKLNATASQKALEYASRKGGLERAYRQTVDHVCTYGKGLIWLYWDDSQVRMVVDPSTGRPVEVKVGDVMFDSGSPFELLVPDVGVPSLGQQHEIMRVRAIPLDELKLRYKDTPGIEDLQGDVSGSELFQYQKQIATLSTRGSMSETGVGTDKASKELNFVTRKELFTRPCGKYPQGRYVVVAGGKVLKYQNVLPYGMHEDTTNPWPVVEFNDLELAGQFWGTSITEQLVGPQREYSEYRQKIINQLNKQAHPKVIVSVFSKWPENAWNDEAGEVIRILTPPNVMEPKIVAPPAISQDIWQALGTISQEIDEMSGLGASALGATGQTTSGFQVNLLQEASDSIHAPDIRGHELAFEELYRKTRKIIKQGYDVNRLISISGRSHIPDVLELSQSNIDEHADIVVYTGNALSNSPAVRTQQVIELWNAGLLVDDINPAEGKRRALTMLDAGGIGEFQSEKRRDEEKSRLENLHFGRQQFVQPPLPFDDHQLHYVFHTDQMKSPEFDQWPPEWQQELVVHTILHMKYINLQQAINTAMEFGLVQLLPLLQPPMPPPMMGNQAPSGAVPPPPVAQQPQQ